MNVLLDTNILTRWVNAEDSQHPEAVECLRRLRTSGHIPTIVPQNLYEFWVVATRPIAVNGLGIRRASKWIRRCNTLACATCLYESRQTNIGFTND